MMKQYLIVLFVTLVAWMAGTPALAALNVFACEPEWGALARELGGERVKVYDATTAFQDPHRVEARPSLLAAVRRADLLVCAGAELEVGWLPILLRESGNGNIQSGRPGHVEAAQWARLIERPSVLDRSMGDVHAAGNPHLHLDPRNIAQVATVLAERLAQVDGANAGYYAARQWDFRTRWEAAMQRWEREAMPLQGVPVAVHHKNWGYLLGWLGMREGMVLEPKPGVDPSLAYLAELVARLKSAPVKMVLRTAYQSPKPSQWVAEKAGIPAVELPFTVGGSERAQDLFGLFDDTIARLLQALR